MLILSQFIDRLNETVGRIVSWAAVFMVLITLLIVILRYFFDMGWIAMQESVVYLHSVLFLLGAAYTLKNSGHVRVDIFYGKMSPQNKARVDFLGSLFLLIPVCVVILFYSIGYVKDAWDVLEGSREAGGIHAVYLLKTLIPAFSILMILQAVSEMIKAWFVMQDKEKHYG